MNTNSNLPRVIGGRYQLLEELGSGGVGKTYRAKDLHLSMGADCAVKQLKSHSQDPALLEKVKELFDREAETLYKLGKNHNQIPQLFAFFAENQEFYLVEELIEGQTLTQELASGQKFSEDDTLEFLEEILEVLKFVHQEGLIHRDIKPDNLIRRDSDQKFVLIDFGSVKSVVFEPGSTEKQQNRTQIGTPGYAPKEQIMLAKPTFSSDIYALGVTAIQTLTGLEPRKLEQDDHTGTFLWRDEIVKELRTDLADVLDKMIHHNPKHRYQCVEDVLERIKELNATTLAIGPISRNRNGQDLGRSLLFISKLAGLVLVFVISSIRVFAENEGDRASQESQNTPKPNVVGSSSIGILSGNPVSASDNNVSFDCQMTDYGVPVTLVKEPGKDPKQFIRWLRPLGGASPEDRCKQVSVRLDRAYKRGNRHITHGVQNRQPVICSTDKKGTGCQNLLWTLHWQEDEPQVVLDDFLLLGQSNYSGRPLRQTSCSTYIDIDAFIQGEKQFAQEVCNAN